MARRHRLYANLHRLLEAIEDMNRGVLTGDERLWSADEVEKEDDTQQPVTM